MALMRVPTVEAAPAVKVKVLGPTVKLVTAPLVKAVVNAKAVALPSSSLVLGVEVPTVLGVVKAVGAPETGAPSTVSSVVTARSARLSGSVTTTWPPTTAAFAPTVVSPLIALIRF